MLLKLPFAMATFPSNPPPFWFTLPYPTWVTLELGPLERWQ